MATHSGSRALSYVVSPRRLYVLGVSGIFTSRRDVETLKTLVNYTVRSDFPHLGEPSKDAYVALFEEVCRTTMQMIVHWMRSDLSTVS